MTFQPDGPIRCSVTAQPQPELQRDDDGPAHVGYPTLTITPSRPARVLRAILRAGAAPLQAVELVVGGVTVVVNGDGTDVARWDPTADPGVRQLIRKALDQLTGPTARTDELAPGMTVLHDGAARTVHDAYPTHLANERRVTLWTVVFAEDRRIAGVLVPGDAPWDRA